MIAEMIFGTLLAIFAFYVICKVTKRNWPDDYPDGWG